MSFYGKEKRCENVITLTISTYDLLLQWQLPLAIMECKKEDAVIFRRFWNYFKQVFKEANKSSERLAANSWISDMVAANFNTLQLLYSEELLSIIKDVEFHLRQSVNKHSLKCANIETFKVFNRISILSHNPFYGPMQSTLFNNLKYLLVQEGNNWGYNKSVIILEKPLWNDENKCLKINKLSHHHGWEIQ